MSSPNETRKKLKKYCAVTNKNVKNNHNCTWDYFYEQDIDSRVIPLLFQIKEHVEFENLVYAQKKLDKVITLLRGNVA